jgi:cell division transport system permease protein
MKYLYIAYFILREAFVYIIRNKTITILSIAVTSFSLFVIALYFNVVENIALFTERIMKELSVNIYLADNITSIQQKYIEKIIKESKYVESYEYIDKDKALNDFLSQMPTFKSIIATLKENPVPSSYRVILKKEYNTENAIRNFISLFEDAEGIDEIHYDRMWFEKLIVIIKLLKFGGTVMGAVLIFTALFTVANVIRLVVYGRKDEIEILKLVGASNFYIKSPFVIEGVFQGLCAAALSLIGVYISYNIIMKYIKESGLLEGGTFLSFLSGGMQIWVVVIGAMIGFVGSFLSVSHVLKERY